jgi:hypothetical protein
MDDADYYNRSFTTTKITTSATLDTTNITTTTTQTYAIKACQAQEEYLPTSRVWVYRGWGLQAGNLEAGSVEAWHRHNDTTYFLSFIHGIETMTPFTCSQFITNPQPIQSSHRKYSD